MSVEIREVPADRLIDLRHRVLRAGLPRSEASFDRDDHPTSIHFAAIEGDTVIGCATLIQNEWNGQPAWQLRGMAVSPEHHRKGIGRQMLDALQKRILSNGYSRILWCNARTPAVPFYKAFGMEAVGEEFNIPTAGPHFKMVKRV